MPINFSPAPGQILMCDYTTGFVPPEMQKVRHCIVLSPSRRTGLCLVVPLSTVAPNPIEDYHYQIPVRPYPCLDQGSDVWVKGDMISHAAYHRLERPKQFNRFASVYLSPEDLQKTNQAVLAGLGHVCEVLKATAPHQ